MKKIGKDMAWEHDRVLLPEELSKILKKNDARQHVKRVEEFLKREAGSLVRKPIKKT